MPRPGRPPKPPHLHVVDGTHRKDRHGSPDEVLETARENLAEPIPRPPRWLGKLARAEWRRMAPQLHSRGLLACRFVAAFACYCRAYGELQEAQALVEKEGRVTTTEHGNEIQHPAVAIANNAARQVRDFLVEFGLSPSAEGRLGGGGVPTEDPFEKWLKEKRDHERSGAKR